MFTTRHDIIEVCTDLRSFRKLYFLISHKKYVISGMIFNYKQNIVGASYKMEKNTWLLFMHTSLCFASLWETSNAFLRVSQSFFLLHTLFFIWKVKVTRGFASYRIQREWFPCLNQITGQFQWSQAVTCLTDWIIPTNQNKKHFLLYFCASKIISQRYRMILENIHPTRVNTTSYDWDTFEILTMSFQPMVMIDFKLYPYRVNTYLMYW